MIDMISRSAWRTMSSARIILMPPPAEPEHVAKQHRNSIHRGAKIGQRAKSTLEKPAVVAIETTLNALWRNAVQKDGYTWSACRNQATPRTDTASSAR